MSENEESRVLDQLFEKHYSAVLKSCLSKVHYQSRFASFAEDAAQEAFLLLVKRYHKIKNHSDLKGWLCAVAWNKLRENIRTTWTHEQVIDNFGKETIGDGVEAFENEIDQWLQSEAFSSEISKIYLTLTEIEKPIFKDYFVEDNSMEETAVKSGLSINTVRSGIERIRKRFRKKDKNIFR